MKHWIFILYVIVVLFLFACKKNNTCPDDAFDYRQEMRDFVEGISAYSKQNNSDFIIIPQNGQELLTNTGNAQGIVQATYVQAIDATGRESMFYGYYSDNEETPFYDNEYLLEMCLLCEELGIEVLSTDYCSDYDKVDNSYASNARNGFISFAANDRELRTIPTYPEVPYNENSYNIEKISQAQNFLYLINGEDFETLHDFVSVISQTNYDVLIIDLFHNGQMLSKTQIEQLAVKHNGGRRLVFCYMSIGEAEKYRYYWNEQWTKEFPKWLEKENPHWEGNYKVQYWDQEWQNIIYGKSDSYLDRILEAGFDGVYLDIVDAFEYFEEN